MGLITAKQIDQIFNELINADPFNPRNAIFVIRFLNFGLIESKLFTPYDLIESLQAIVALGKEQIELIQTQLNMLIIPMFEKLISLYENLDAPLIQLSKGSKLTRFSTFEPLADVDDQIGTSLTEEIKHWEEVIHTPDVKDEDIISAADTIFKLSADAIKYIFITQKDTL